MRAIDQRPSSSQKSRTHSLPGFRRESNNPRKKNRSESPGFRFPAPLSGPAGSLAWAYLAALSATAAARVEQLCMWAPTLSAAQAEWWHRTVALSATEGPFVLRGTRASYTRHNDTVHSPPLHNEGQGVGFSVCERKFLPANQTLSVTGGNYLSYNTAIRELITLA